MTVIVHDDDIRSGDPRIQGTRITVFDVKQRVIDNGEDPHIVAGEYDISMTNLFYALAYYYEHRAALSEREREIDVARREGKQQTWEILERAENGAAETGRRAD
ncbi:DUF433 domain-containing protein [Halocatena marina]|uniref:DUF433 domain-containing protein n=1 Tax=Halocatena marina TaxID=2934937 RepID=UPI0020107808|nr:DUF433 domain-containing protein [Halocatena marina]